MLGRTDLPATPAGIAACVEQASTLPFDRILCSGLARSDACAQAIGAAAGVPVARDARWREIDFGPWDGRAPAEIDAAALQAYWADPEGAAPPEGERWSALLARVSAALAEVADGTLVVSHGGAIRASLSVACGFPHANLWAFDLPYAAVVTLRLWRGAGGPAAQIVRLAT